MSCAWLGSLSYENGASGEAQSQLVETFNRWLNMASMNQNSPGWSTEAEFMTPLLWQELQL